MLRKEAEQQRLLKLAHTPKDNVLGKLLEIFL